MLQGSSSHVQLPRTPIDSNHHQSGVKCHANQGDNKASPSSSCSQYSLCSSNLTSIESDGWSQRGVSSRVSLDVESTVNNFDCKGLPSNDDGTKCSLVHKLWRNFILPGVFGIESKRIVKKRFHKHPVSKQVINNITTYSSIVRDYVRSGPLPAIKNLATQMYFPTGQIEADGLSVISAEIWAATYILLNFHKHLREADFHTVRNAYPNLAWDSNQMYRTAIGFRETIYQFQEAFMPLWREIELLVGIQDTTDIDQNDTTKQFYEPRPKISVLKKLSVALGLSSKSEPVKIVSELPKLRISDQLTMQNPIRLHIIPEIKSATMTSTEVIETDFYQWDYASQSEVVKELLAKPACIIQNAKTVLQQMEPHLKNVMAKDLKDENVITCDRALKILHANLKLLFKEVMLTPALRLELGEVIRATSQDIRAFLAYSEWVTSKLFEFHGMQKLCYNFAHLCFDLDLPSFGSVLKKEEACLGITSCGTRSENDLEKEQESLEFKVVSLTKLMMDASNSLSSVQNLEEGEEEEDYDWADFYKTDYHWILQRLPLRLGMYLLQFSETEEAKYPIRQRRNDENNMVLMSYTPSQKVQTMYRKDDFVEPLQFRAV